MSQDPLAPRYRSGDDVTLAAGAVRFHFAREDFAQRVVAAATRLGLVHATEVSARDRDDLGEVAIHGAAPDAASDACGGLAEHLRQPGAVLTHEGRDLAHWLRRLVMRGAWLDQQVTDGRLEPVFAEGRGFGYRAAGSEAPAPDDPGAPDWSSHAYRRTPA